MSMAIQRALKPGAFLLFVAASGNPFVPNKERGLYRSNDGGKTWKTIPVADPKNLTQGENERSLPSSYVAQCHR